MRGRKAHVLRSSVAARDFSMGFLDGKSMNSSATNGSFHGKINCEICFHGDFFMICFSKIKDIIYLNGSLSGKIIYKWSFERDVKVIEAFSNED